jgi:hypothetical protein
MRGSASRVRAKSEGFDLGLPGNASVRDFLPEFDGEKIQTVRIPTGFPAIPSRAPLAHGGGKLHDKVDVPREIGHAFFAPPKSLGGSVPLTQPNVSFLGS